MAALNEELDRTKAQSSDLEQQITILRRHNDELDTQLKSGQAKITALENELASNRKEIQALGELNQQLQRERQEALK